LGKKTEKNKKRGRNYLLDWVCLSMKCKGPTTVAARVLEALDDSGVIITSGRLMNAWLFPRVMPPHMTRLYHDEGVCKETKISHLTPGYWQGSGNDITENVYTQFLRSGLHKPVFLSLHQNHSL
jgi:hypothetical protein